MAVATFEATEAAASVVFTTLASVKNNYFYQFNYGRPMEWGRPLYFCPVVSSSFFFLSFFPRLISAVADWMSAILPHMVWP